MYNVPYLSNRKIHVTVVRLPKWKHYLYTLAWRWRMFKAINRKNQNVFGIRRERYNENQIMHYCLKRFGKGGVYRKKLKAFVIYEFVKTCEENQSRLRDREFYLATKFATIKKLGLETLMAEIKELKGFASEVGLSRTDIKGLEEDELILKIVGEVDPKAKYSKAFVAWYENLDPAIFDEDEGESEGESGEEEEVNLDELREAIEDCDDIDELKGYVDSYEDIFDAKLKKKKDLEELQEAMIAAIEDFEENKEEEPEEKKPAKKEEKPSGKNSAKKEEPEEEESEDEEIDKNELIQAIKDAEDVDELKGYIKEFPALFEGVNTRGRIKLETLQTAMLDALGEGETSGVDDDLLEELNTMSKGDLRKYARTNFGLEYSIKDSKEDIIEGIVKAASEAGETEEDQDELEITPTVIQDLVKAKDLETLKEICGKLEIKVSMMEKNSAKRMAEKILAAIADTEEETKTEKKEAKKTKVEKGVLGTIEDMINDGAEDAAIIKAMTPILKEKGLSGLDAKRKIQQFIEIAKL